MQPSPARGSANRYGEVGVWAGLLSGESRGETSVRDTCALQQGVVPGVWEYDAILLKWRSLEELHLSFLQNTRKTSYAYLYQYSLKLHYELESKVRLSTLNPGDRIFLDKF
jgi:uncharacterized protein (DUF2235 family)